VAQELTDLSQVIRTSGLEALRQWHDVQVLTTLGWS
jgi:hypothetical protein